MTSAQQTLAPPAATVKPRREPSRLVYALPLLALFAVASAVLVHYALQVRTWQPDEVIYVVQGRELGNDFPAALFNTQIFHYGIERIVPLLGALTGWVFSDTGTAMQVHKALIAIAFASITIPVYLLARGVRLERGWALAASALAVAVPWAALATSFLNDPVAYPAFAWAIYGIWRACAYPGWRSDLIALACVIAAALARSNLAVVGGALVLAILATELRYGRRAGVKDTVLGILRDHIPVVVAIAFGVLFLAVRGKSGLTGAYPVDFTPPLGLVLGQSRAFLSYIAQGLVLAPVIIGTAWAFRHFIAPLDRERHALAAAAIFAALVLLYSLHGGEREERYVFELAPLMTTMMVVAIARRDVPILAIAASAVGVALLVHGRDPAPAISGSYLPFAYPGQGWYQQVVRGRASEYLPGGLASHLDDLLVIGIPLLVVIAMFLVLRGRRLGRVAGIALVAVQLAIGVGAAHWALDKYVNEAGDPHGASYSAHAWVDHAIGKDSRVGGLYAESGPTADGISAEIRFWNASADLSATGLEHLQAEFDPRTGRPLKPLPGDILIANGERQRFGITGKPVATSTIAPVQLFKTSPSTRAAWAITPSYDGWIPATNRRVEVRTWTTCVGFRLTAPPDRPVTVSWRAAGARPATIKLAANQSRNVATQRPGKSVLIAKDNGAPLTASLKAVTTVPCPS